jgi:hypothetical protein
MNKIKSSTVIACEYIAQGVHGKHTLVNLYSGDILVKEFPVAVLLSFYVELHFSGTGGKTLLRLDVLLGGKPHVGLQAEIVLEPNKPGLILVPQTAFMFEKKTEIKILATVDDARATTLMRKTISQGEIPT